MVKRKVVFTNEVDTMIKEVIQNKSVVSFKDYYALVVEVRKRMPNSSLNEIKQRIRIFFKLCNKYTVKQ